MKDIKKGNRMIEKITTEDYIFYRYDDYDEHNKKIMMVNEDGCIFAFNEDEEELTDFMLCINDKETMSECNIEYSECEKDHVYISLTKTDLPVLKIENIDSFIEVYDKLSDGIEDETLEELIHLYKNCLSSHRHSDRWLKHFAHHKNSMFWTNEFNEIIEARIPIVLYRGCYQKEIDDNEYGISWTYDEKIALCFNEAVVKVETTLDKAIYVIDGREKEIIFKPSKEDLIVEVG